MKTVFASAFQEESLVVCSMLESAGITADVLVDSMLDINPLYSIDIKGAQVVVPDDQAADAKAIVDDFLINRAAARNSGKSTGKS